MNLKAILAIEEAIARFEEPSSDEVMGILRHAGLIEHASATLAALAGRAPGDRVRITTVPRQASPSTSARESDAFDNGPKTASREGNLLAVVEQAPELWEGEGERRLRCSWAELMGKTGVLTLAMLERARVLAPGGFVGIDMDAETIADLRVRLPDYRWVAGDLLDLLRAPELEDVGVLNFDAYDMVGAPSVRPRARLVADLARRSIEKLGAFALCWNADLDATRLHGIPASVGLRRHALALSESFAGVLSPRRRLGADELASETSAAVVDDPGFVGRVGHFEIYRGKPTGHRMANLRVVLR